MSESPAPGPAPRPSRRPSRGTRARPAKSKEAGLFDKLMIGGALALLALIGFVAYRTQVQGLPIEAALPFFSSENSDAQGDDGATGPGGERFPGDVPDPSRRKSSAGKAGPGAVEDENNTFFGRRERSSRRPASAPATPTAPEGAPASPDVAPGTGASESEAPAAE